MDVEHTITVIAEVDGVEVHRTTFPLKATGAVGDALGNFDPAVAVIGALRLEADVLQAIMRRERGRGGYTVIDAASEPR